MGVWDMAEPQPGRGELESWWVCPWENPAPSLYLEGDSCLIVTDPSCWKNPKGSSAMSQFGVLLDVGVDRILGI